MTTTTVPRGYFRYLTELAAEQLGYASAARLEQGQEFVDVREHLGFLICETWRVDQPVAKIALRSYMRVLEVEAKKRDVVPPGLPEVLEALPQLVNRQQYPDIDVPTMLSALVAT